MNFTAAQERKGKQTFLFPSPLYYERRIAEEYYYYYDYYYGCRRERDPLSLSSSSSSRKCIPPSASDVSLSRRRRRLLHFWGGGEMGSPSLSLSSLSPSPCTVCPTVVGSSSSSSMVVGVCCTADPVAHPGREKGFELGRRRRL